jgi:hypothetical protein
MFEATWSATRPLNTCSDFMPTSAVASWTTGGASTAERSPVIGFLGGGDRLLTRAASKVLPSIFRYLNGRLWNAVAIKIFKVEITVGEGAVSTYLSDRRRGS